MSSGPDLRGVLIVARQEFRLRLRSGRWRLLLGIWTAVLLVVTALLVASAAAAFGASQIRGGAPVPLGPTVFGFLLLFLLSLALLLVPAIAAQSINGDRDRGTLATVQVTLLAPVEIVLGKFVAAWGTALVFVALSLPSVIWAVALGGVGVLRAVAVLSVLAVLLGVVAAVSLALSALVERTTLSGVLAYLTVFTLTVGTLIVFGLVTASTTDTRPDNSVRYDYDAQGNQVGAPIVGGQVRVARTDRTWWLLAPNPFVILADAAPGLPELIDPQTGRTVQAGSTEPLGAIQSALRSVRTDPATELGPEPTRGSAGVWPWGLAFDVALAAGALWLTARRLRTPARALPRGSRVA